MESDGEKTTLEIAEIYKRPKRNWTLLKLKDSSSPKHYFLRLPIKIGTLEPGFTVEFLVEDGEYEPLLEPDVIDINKDAFEFFTVYNLSKKAVLYMTIEDLSSLSFNRRKEDRQILKTLNKYSGPEEL